MAVEHLTWSGPLVAIVSLRAGCLRGDGRLCESIPRPSLAPRCCYVGLGGAGQTWRFRERSSDPSPSSPTEPRHFLVHRRPDDGPAQVLKILEHVLNHSLVQRAEVCARMAKRVSTREVPEIPLMNCQSKPLLSLTNNARPFVFSRIQRAKFSITPSGSSKPSVSPRVNPLTARVSGTHLSEMGLSLP
jgi:hypothetical protein